MKYAVVYVSGTGNTTKVARAIRSNHATRYEDAQSTRQASKRRDLRHRQHSAKHPPSACVQFG